MIGNKPRFLSMPANELPVLVEQLNILIQTDACCAKCYHWGRGHGPFGTDEIAQGDRKICWVIVDDDYDYMNPNDVCVCFKEG